MLLATSDVTRILADIEHADPAMMNPLHFRRMMTLVFTVLSMIPGAAHAGDPAFDAWAEDLAAQVMRTDPKDSTREQYFKGDEQDAVDRRLTPCFTGLFGNATARVAKIRVQIPLNASTAGCFSIASAAIYGKDFCLKTLD
jgi:hypothetical protein